MTREDKDSLSDVRQTACVMGRFQRELIIERVVKEKGKEKKRGMEKEVLLKPQMPEIEEQGVFLLKDPG